jgi:hypothetical protein
MVKPTTLLLTVVGASTGCLSCGDNRGGEVPAIRADLRVGETGRLLLCDLTLKKVQEGGPFIIARVGDWSPGARFRGRHPATRYVAGCPNSVDVKAGSPFVELTTFPLTGGRGRQLRPPGGPDRLVAGRPPLLPGEGWDRRDRVLEDQVQAVARAYFSSWLE